MRINYLIAIAMFSLINSCFSQSANKEIQADFVISFGSCNRTDLENKLWDDILEVKPNLWIWGGDNVYADTDDMQKMRADYQKQLNVEAYQELIATTNILGTWDDHDYGLDDGGTEFHKKKESQQEFLNFLGVPQNDVRRKREGVYMSQIFETDKGVIKIIVLDTRYHRTSIIKNKEGKKRYTPNEYGEGTVLGQAQWKWLERELYNSEADFNIVVSSVQLLSGKHGWETWGNFPHEVDRFLNLVKESKAKGVVVLSGDRHISDFSKKEIEGMDYPLIDFTSSGLTHSATVNKGEENPYRVGNLVNQLSFGVLKFNFDEQSVTMEMIGDEGKVYQTIKQLY
ncbi:alkaline phosphatase family protein [Flavobacteriaceae bacterium R38]|nr:alkaline phosphatase family protein [Flavobacteriaceae bacterium R38]